MPASSSLFLVPLLVPILLLKPSYGHSLHPVERPTHRDDLIGFYTLHPKSYLAARNRTCPANITTTTLVFHSTQAPRQIDAPSHFNLRIAHFDTRLNGQPCESAGNIQAITHDHPYVHDRVAVVRAWAGVGNSLKPVTWLANASHFLDNVATHAFAVGYDFAQRTCNGSLLPASAFLWFQPTFNSFVADFPVEGSQKYLFLVHQNPYKRFGCIYVAQAIGGHPPFGRAPVDDPTVEDDDDSPPNHGQWSAPPTPTAPANVSEPSPTFTDVAQPTDESPNDAGTEPPSTSITGTTTVGSTTTVSTTTRSSVFGDAADEDEDDDDDNGQNDSDPEDSSACFPASATVHLEDGRIVEMRSLQRGMRVHSGHDEFSSVFAFTHASEETFHKFVNVTLETGHSIVASAGHYLHTSEDELITASSVTPSRTALRLANGQSAKVHSKQWIVAKGLFAPHTVSERLVVNGVLASSYTSAVHPRLARVLLLPLRWLGRWRPRLVDAALIDERSSWRRAVLTCVSSGPRTLSWLSP